MNNLAIKQQILDKIESYARIIISRHKRPDGDAIGSTMGLWHVLKATYPEKEIYLQNEDTSEYLAFWEKKMPPSTPRCMRMRW